MRITIPWTKEDLDLLKECKGKYLDDIVLLFPKRKRRRIVEKCNSLGIKVIFSPSAIKWTDDETNLLLKTYKNTSPTFIRL